VRATITKARTRKVKSLPQQEIIGFMFQLEMLIRAGVPILAALGDMRDSAESMEGQIARRGGVSAGRERVHAG
jgi:type IV pilus assembly protein PilC